MILRKTVAIYNNFQKGNVHNKKLNTYVQVIYEEKLNILFGSIKQKLNKWRGKSGSKH